MTSREQVITHLNGLVQPLRSDGLKAEVHSGAEPLLRIQIPDLPHAAVTIGVDDAEDGPVFCWVIGTATRHRIAPVDQIGSTLDAIRAAIVR